MILESWSFWMSAISFAMRRVRLEEAIVRAMGGEGEWWIWWAAGRQRVLVGLEPGSA
jgi:hypothetical protein